MSEIPPPAVPPSTPPPPGSGSYTPPPPPPPPLGGGPTAPGPGAGGDRTIMLVLSYLGVFALIPLLTKKEDSELQWHAKNGLAIFGAEIIVCVLFIVLSRIPVLGCLAAIVSCFVPLLFLGVFIFCLIQALNGKRPRIPFISDFADKM